MIESKHVIISTIGKYSNQNLTNSNLNNGLRCCSGISKPPGTIESEADLPKLDNDSAMSLRPCK
jgi:hypothetical protein